MAICPVCGCKTDALDFVKGRVGECEADICSFCDKQIKGLSDVAEVTPAQARWLTAVLTKDAAGRSVELYNELKAIGEKCQLPLFNKAEEKPEPQQIKTAAKVNAPANADVKDEVIAQLNERIAALEKQLKAMKRNMLIKSIMEICIPIILGILILIVFFASGLYDTLASLYNDFM